MTNDAEPLSLAATDWPQKFRYGAFDRIGMMVILATVLLIAPQFMTAAPSTVADVLVEIGFLVGAVLITWFTLLRSTAIFIGRHGVRSAAFGLPLRRLAWEDVTQVREHSIGRGMKSLRIESRSASVTAVSDLVGYERLKGVLRDQTGFYPFRMIEADGKVWPENAAQGGSGG